MDYLAPLSLKDAVDLLAEHAGGARVMAGGTALIPELTNAGSSIQVILDIKRIGELCSVAELGDGTIRLGAALSLSVLADDERVRRHSPGLVDAAALSGPAQIRGRASLGGGLCLASASTDIYAALLARDAVCRIHSAGGNRVVAIADLAVAPGRTCLRPDELLVSIDIPPRATHAADAYQRMTTRSGLDRALAGVAVSLSLRDDKVQACRVALAAVTPVPALAERAAAALVGSQLDADAVMRFRRQVASSCRTVDDTHAMASYRSHMAAELAENAARLAWSRAVGECTR